MNAISENRRLAHLHYNGGWLEERENKAFHHGMDVGFSSCESMLEASLSREKVLREALEETLRCITSADAGGYLKNMQDRDSRKNWFLDKCIPAAHAARAALASTETEK